jgi:hypothetical protein
LEEARALQGTWLNADGLRRWHRYENAGLSPALALYPKTPAVLVNNILDSAQPNERRCLAMSTREQLAQTG